MTMAHIHTGNATTNGVQGRVGLPPARLPAALLPCPHGWDAFCAMPGAISHRRASFLLALLPGPPVVILVPVDGTAKVGRGLAGAPGAPADRRVLLCSRSPAGAQAACNGLPCRHATPHC